MKKKNVLTNILVNALFISMCLNKVVLAGFGGAVGGGRRK